MNTEWPELTTPPVVEAGALVIMTPPVVTQDPVPTQLPWKNSNQWISSTSWITGSIALISGAGIAIVTSGSLCIETVSTSLVAVIRTVTTCQKM